jgi:hypothetical protein
LTEYLIGILAGYFARDGILQKTSEYRRILRREPSDSPAVESLEFWHFGGILSF